MKIKKYEQEFCERERMYFDKVYGCLCGERNGYTFLVKPYMRNRGQYDIVVSVSDMTLQEIDKNRIKEALRERKYLSFRAVEGRKLYFSVRSDLSRAKTLARVGDELAVLPDILRGLGFVNCCSACGKLGDTGVYMTGGNPLLLCEECFVSENRRILHEQESDSYKKEGILTGLIGAFIGASIGVLVIVLVWLLGYVAVLGGTVMSVCSLKGYELLGGKLTKKGIVFSVIISLVLVPISARIGLSLQIAQTNDVPFGYVFRILPQVVRKQGMVQEYYAEIAKLYTWTIIGVLITIVSTLKNRKESRESYKIC